MSSSSRRLQDPISYHEQVDIGCRAKRIPMKKQIRDDHSNNLY